MHSAERQEAGRIAENVARRSYGRLLALLVRRTRDIASAEDALSDAFAAALREWPAQGVPANPEAWLMTVARRKWIDAVRRIRTAEEAEEDLRFAVKELAEPESEEARTGEDERLLLMFACAHPAIDAAVRAPLILQTILGFDAAAIGSAFLTSPATMAQRLVRAKRKIRDTGIPFQMPDDSDLPLRLDAVLNAIYAAFAEGWSDATGADVRRRQLAEDAIWLGRHVASRLPSEAEALGLVSLMLHAQARRPARRDTQGAYVPLADQDPGLWDGTMLAEAEALLARANKLPGMGRFQLEAAVQSAHAARRFTGQSDWRSILALYDALSKLTGSPVVAVNRAVALAECFGPESGLSALSEVAEEPRLANYQPFWAARAELLGRAGDAIAARAAFERAIGLESDPAIRRFLEQRSKTFAGRGGPKQ